MNVEVSRESAWKAMHAANHHAHETIDAGSYPVTWRVQVLMTARETFVGTSGTTWTRGARKLKQEDGAMNMQMAEIDGTRQVSVDEAIVERVTEAATDEQPDAPVEDQSFDENLRIVLDAWNTYYGKKGVGWRD